MKECPNCAVDIQESKTVCPICRYEFPRRAAIPWKPVALAVLTVVGFYILLNLVRNLSP